MGSRRDFRSACARGETERLLAIAAHSADVVNGADDKTGETPLHVHQASRDIVLVLLRLGANPNARNKHGETPLHYAVSADRVDVLHELTRFGGDPNIRSGAGLRARDLKCSREVMAVLDEAEVLELHIRDELARLMLHADLMLPRLMCESLSRRDHLPRMKRNRLVQALLHLCRTQLDAIALIRHVLIAEVHRTSDAEMLLRTDSIATKLCTEMFQAVGAGANDALLPIVQDILAQDPVVYEVDPALVPNDCSIDANLVRLGEACRHVLEAVMTSVARAPPAVLAVLSDLYQVVEERFPGHGRAATGAFLFLRVLSPMLMAPHEFELAPALLPEQRQRPLILVAKALQALANGTLFGEDAHMAPLNHFLTTCQEAFQTFLGDFAPGGAFAQLDATSEYRLGKLPVCLADPKQRPRAAFLHLGAATTSADLQFLHVLATEVLVELATDARVDAALERAKVFAARCGTDHVNTSPCTILKCACDSFKAHSTMPAICGTCKHAGGVHRRLSGSGRRRGSAVMLPDVGDTPDEMVEHLVRVLEDLGPPGAALMANWEHH